MSKQEEKGVYHDKIPQLKQLGSSKLREQLSKGLGILVVIISGIILYFLMLRLTDIVEAMSVVTAILMPIIYGAVIAYLLNPLAMKVDGYVYDFLTKKLKWEETHSQGAPKKVSRAIGVIVSMCFFLSVVFLLISLIIPELVDSVQNLMETLPAQISAFSATISAIQIQDGEMVELIEYAYTEVVGYAKTWIQSELLLQVNSWMSNITVGVIAFVGWIFDFIMGIILAAYLLLSKEKFLNQMKKTIYAMLPVSKANITLHIMKKSNDIFGGFIIGKIIDSMLMGMITFVAMQIMNMPYGLLISVIVGVTNIVPYFGPIIGAVPCALLVLLQSPIQCLYFVIYIIILQQVDGNIIGPKILGDSTGLSAFWVIFSILLGSGLFGFVGMIMGVPTFAVIYYIVKMFLEQRLEGKDLPPESECYDTLSYVDTITGEYMASDEVRQKRENIKHPKAAEKDREDKEVS